MGYFYSDESKPITSEMLRQNCDPDIAETLRIVRDDEESFSTDIGISVGVAAVAIACGTVTLALSGFVPWLLFPVASLGLSSLRAWNTTMTKRDRGAEYDFLHAHPEVIDLVRQKVAAGHSRHTIAAAYEVAFQAFCHQQKEPLKLLVLAGNEPIPQPPALPTAPYPVDAGVQDANQGGTIGNNTRLGAIDVPAVAVSPMPTAPPLPDNIKAELLGRLKAECPALVNLIKAHPIRAVGVQRTGKTTLVKKLALLRLLLLPGHQVIASTPHHEAGNHYPDVFHRVGLRGTQRDYGAIAQQWAGMAHRIESNAVSSITTIWDEFGLYDRVVDEESLIQVVTSSLREATKHGEYPVFVVHGETQKFLPGSKGLVTVFLDSTVRVETIGELIDGADGLPEMKPTGKFRVTWLDGTTGEGQIPAWLTEEYLLSLVPAQHKPTAPPRPTAPLEKPVPRQGADVRQTLDRLFGLPAAEHEVEESAQESGASLEALKSAFPEGSPKFLDVALKVIEYLEKRRGQTAKPRDLQSGVRGLGKLSAPKVREFLSALGEKGFIQILTTEDGKETYAAIDLSSDDDFSW